MRFLFWTFVAILQNERVYRMFHKGYVMSFSTTLPIYESRSNQSKLNGKGIKKLGLNGIGLNWQQLRRRGWSYMIPLRWKWRTCQNDAARHANGISGFCAKNAISAKRQPLGRRGWNPMLPLAFPLSFPCHSPHQKINANAKMTPQDAQMAFPVFAPKKRHLRQMTASGKTWMV